MGPYWGRIEAILQADRAMPRKQRHTAKRIWEAEQVRFEPLHYLALLTPRVHTLEANSPSYRLVQAKRHMNRK